MITIVAITSSTSMIPPVVAPPTRPRSQRMINTIARAYDIRFFLSLGRLILRHRCCYSHVVDHEVDAVDVVGKLGNQALFCVVFGDAAQGDNPISRGNSDTQCAGG